MKRRSATLLVAGIVTSLFLSSCGGSQAGKWSEEDKASFRKDMNEVDLSAFGEDKDALIDCYLSKCEAKYNSYFAANQDEAGCKKMSEECGEEVLSNGSVKGKWSDEDKETFRKDMLASGEELETTPEKLNAWIECMLTKCEQRFKSYYDANQSATGAEEVSTECAGELIE